LAPGALQIGMSRAAATVRSMWSVPAAGCWIKRRRRAAATTSGVITAFDGKRTSTSATAAVSGDLRSQVVSEVPSGNRAAICSTIGSHPEPQEPQNNRRIARHFTSCSARVRLVLGSRSARLGFGSGWWGYPHPLECANTRREGRPGLIRAANRSPLRDLYTRGAAQAAACRRPNTCWRLPAS